MKRFAGAPLGATLDVMMVRLGDLLEKTRRQLATAALGASMLMIAAGYCWPQAASPPPSLDIQEPAQQAVAPQPGTAPSAPEPARQENPGLINEMGKLFEKSLSIWPRMKSPGETIDDLNTRAKDAGESLSHLAKPSSMVSGRIACPVSANGAPDCKLAADKLCQAKGYREGKSLNTDSAQTCSAKVLIPGRVRKPDDCRTDNFVTSALCQ